MHNHNHNFEGQARGTRMKEHSPWAWALLPLSCGAGADNVRDDALFTDRTGGFTLVQPPVCARDTQPRPPAHASSPLGECMLHTIVRCGRGSRLNGQVRLDMAAGRHAVRTAPPEDGLAHKPVRHMPARRSRDANCQQRRRQAPSPPKLSVMSHCWAIKRRGSSPSGVTPGSLSVHCRRYGAGGGARTIYEQSVVGRRRGGGGKGMQFSSAPKHLRWERGGGGHGSKRFGVSGAFVDCPAQF